MTNRYVLVAAAVSGMMLGACASATPKPETSSAAPAAEAMAFSLMGRNAVLGLPNHLPRCTGANRATVLGESAPGRSTGTT